MKTQHANNNTIDLDTEELNLQALYGIEFILDEIEAYHNQPAKDDVDWFGLTDLTM